MFKDYKTGGDNLEDTKVNETRFLALVLLIAIAIKFSDDSRTMAQEIRYRNLCRTDLGASRQNPTTK